MEDKYVNPKDAQQIIDVARKVMDAICASDDKESIDFNIVSTALTIVMASLCKDYLDQADGTESIDSLLSNFTTTLRGTYEFLNDKK